jgi:NADH:ubiquinone oxidoreductase subunit C
MVSRDASMSIVVSKVAETQTQMIMLAEKAGGFMVNASTSSPEESSSGNFTVRVPSDKLTEVMTAYRKMGVKVASEQITGVDITDQYTDIQARLAPLKDTYAQFDQLRREAGTIEEKMNLLSQLQNLQSQIDSLVGQQKYLENTSTTSRITVYLSADEYDLPYAPAGSWRPEVIFKQSVRDLVTTLRGLGTWLIGVAVYSVIWLPLLFIGIFVYRRFYKPKV